MFPHISCIPWKIYYAQNLSDQILASWDFDRDSMKRENFIVLKIWVIVNSSL